MKKLAEELNISIRLLFTEAGHGKSPCDGVGGNIKTQVENAMLNDFGNKEVESIHTAEDVKKVIEEKTNLKYEISIHKKEDIDKVKESMPKLSALVGALKLHEVMITSDGVIKKKDLPTDTFYKQVTIRESRIHREVILGANQNPESELDALNVAYIEDTLTQDEDNNTLENDISARRHIMTNDEIAAELEADTSNNSDFDDSD